MEQILEFDVKDLQELKDWLKSQFIEFKPGAGSYQLIRIQTLKKGYRGIYQSPRDSSVYLVDHELNSTIRAFHSWKERHDKNLSY